MKRLILSLSTVYAALASVGADMCPVSENSRGHENIEWSISYAYGLTDETKNLPRVLLIGDSICNGYQGEVRKLLNGKMNVTYWVSSYCVSSPAFSPLLSVYLNEADYDVIHFNNGLHSLSTPAGTYAKALESALKLMRLKQPKAKIIWCSSTPLADEAKTAKCRELNEAAAKVVGKLGNIATNDLFSLLEPLERKANWSDVYHHKAPLRAKEAKAVADIILKGLDGR